MERITEIIRHEREADRLQAEGDAHRWEAARLIAEELAAGTTQQALADRIVKSRQHVSVMRRVHDRYHGSDPPFAQAYAQVKATPEPPESSSAPPRVRTSEGQGTSREPEVRERVRRHMRDHDGQLPTSRRLAREMGLKDDRTTRAAWDNLAGKGQLPPRPGPATRK